MSKLYKGNVTLGIHRDDNDVAVDLRLKADPNGAFNSENASELLAKADEVSKAQGLPLNTWSFWFPLGRKKGLVPCLLAAKWGKPKLVLLKPLAKKSTKKARFVPIA